MWWLLAGRQYNKVRRTAKLTTTSHQASVFSNHSSIDNGSRNRITFSAIPQQQICTILPVLRWKGSVLIHRRKRVGCIHGCCNIPPSTMCVSGSTSPVSNCAEAVSDDSSWLGRASTVVGPIKTKRIVMGISDLNITRIFLQIVNPNSLANMRRILRN